MAPGILLKILQDNFSLTLVLVPSFIQVCPISEEIHTEENFKTITINMRPV